MLSRLVAAAVVIFLLTPLLSAQQAPGHTADDRIYDEVRRKLADDADVKGAAFDVSVKDGVVTLRGRVHNDKAKEKATRLTKKIKGVTGVVNELRMFDE
jgi:osmotically-inducible protein OsmY